MQNIKIAGVEVFVEGDGTETIVMLHGWPDTYRIWEKQVAFFKADYRCVYFTLPGYDINQPRKAYSYQEMTAILSQIIDYMSPEHKVILMLHDWGCTFGYEYAMQNPSRVSKMIGIDIGNAKSPEFIKESSIAAKAMIASYMSTLAAMWFLGGPMADRVTRVMAKAFKSYADPQSIFSGMNYPYAIQVARIKGSFNKLKPIEPKCPFFFAYGLKKPFPFHTQSWLQNLSQQPIHKVQSYQVGHWVMVEAHQQFNQDVAAWLKTTLG